MRHLEVTYTIQDLSASLASLKSCHRIYLTLPTETTLQASGSGWRHVLPGPMWNTWVMKGETMKIDTNSNGIGKITLQTRVTTFDTVQTQKLLH